MDPKKQQLPPKENSLFKRILKCYEQKQYKNGLKFAKQILANYADHGETLAMKGLILNCLGRKEDAYNFVRQGLRNNLKSHVCWHVFGLLQRSDKKYDEAIKCYRNALKWDKDNLQILRDLSLLQIQMRDLEGYKETRYKLFELRPTQRASWIGYAMSFHLLKDFDTALKILEEFRKTIHKTTYDYEYSELLLYQNLVMRESKKLTEALKHLNTYESNICDKVTLQEIRGDIMLELGMKADASEVYRGLVKRNPENRNYYLKLEETLGLTTVEQKLELYKQLKEKYPRAQVPKRLPLNYARGEVLESLLDPYLRAALQKGVPPLFTDLRSLYDDPERVGIIEKLMNRYLANLEETGHLCEEDNEYKEPASILYVLMFLAQHHSYLGDPDKALTLIERALEHTPTLIELYIVKGKILKDAGDYVGAYEALQEAQALDTADRYVNSKAASYLLKANLVKQAEEMCSKFTREGVSAMENLNEMQCMWFQTECAQAYFRLSQYGDALRKCHEVDRHFTEIIEDQFDFHTYCMRKMTLRSYVELLRLEDILRSNRFYWDAAQTAIAIYLRLHDHPLSANTGDKDLNTVNMDPAELKKLRSKQRKAAKKAEQSKAEEKRREEKKAEYQKYKSGGNVDEQENKNVQDLIPSKLEQTEDPLGEAIHFLKPLQSLAANRIQTHLMAFEIYLRKDKPLLMLQALKRALKLEENHPELHSCLVRFLRYRQDKLASLTGPIIDVINKEVNRLQPTADPTKLNEDFLNKNQDSLPHRLQAARSMVLLDSIQRDRAFSIATNLDAHLKARSHQNLQRVLEWLESEEYGASPEEVSHYKAQCHAIYPRAQAFKPPQTASTSVNDSTSDSTTITTPSTTTTANHNHVDFPSS
ncbi:N-alpha-acetyltransferase 15, NatA auxiliary subunit [Penaeus vannamei]|uniref:N-alpha-acetyltransferase 15, NatA auxiliary subunit n=1 Tax=Penaeus vannamei TaxID=6689 RepID=UPI000F68542C|nr:N-alpha-acetyltransferase 15, NatA auxiliary subunit-like [Penaeus vannamei]